MFNPTNKSSQFVKLACAAAAVCVGLASAVGAAELPQVHVSYADLNLNSDAGANVLYQRIRSAADQVCGAHDERDLARITRVRACTAQATADAVAAVGSDALTRLYQAKTGSVTTTKLASLH